MKKLVLVLMMAALLVPFLMAGGNSEKIEEPDKDVMTPDDSMMMDKDEAMTPDGAMMMEDKMMYPDEPGFYSTEKLQPRIVPFVAERAAMAFAEEGPTVYFFAASWCPTCRNAMKNFEAEVASIPMDVTIVLVNYDSQNALKKKYGVVSQHTFVQIDAEGEKLAVWAGSLHIIDVLKRLKGRSS